MACLMQTGIFQILDGHNISQAAYAVGYASPSQFSREFKRLFGLPPRAAIQRLAMATQA